MSRRKTHCDIYNNLIRLGKVTSIQNLRWMSRVIRLSLPLEILFKFKLMYSQCVYLRKIFEHVTWNSVFWFSVFKASKCMYLSNKKMKLYKLIFLDFRKFKLNIKHVRFVKAKLKIFFFIFDLGMGTTLQEMGRMLQQNPDQLQTLKERLQPTHPEIAQVNRKI